MKCDICYKRAEFSIYNPGSDSDRILCQSHAELIKTNMEKDGWRVKLVPITAQP